MSGPDVLTIYKDDGGEWRWRVTAPNHEVISAATEGYVKLADCMANIMRVVNLRGDVDVSFEDEP